MKNKDIRNFGMTFVEVSLFVLASFLVFLLLSFFSHPVSGDKLGEPNATVVTSLTVGEVAPDVLNLTANEGDETITLAANDTVTVSCTAIIRDFNGEGNLSTVTGRFFHNADSSYEGAEDNNTHYRNSSCNLTETTNDWSGIPDDEYHSLANCSFTVYYYASPGIWNCTMWVNDSLNFNSSDSDPINVSELLALTVPNTINFGVVNATDMSNENTTNVTNVGNVMFNLSFSGYGYQENDGNAMNCTLGTVKNISIEHEKFNLTETNPGVLAFGAADALYENMTSSAIVRQFNLDYRRNDATQDAINATFWRVYVPTGVAGSCQGNIIFGAVQAAHGP